MLFAPLTSQGAVITLLGSGYCDTTVEVQKHCGPFLLWSTKMTQKGDMFKGQQKKKIPPNRHGKAAHIRKGIIYYRLAACFKFLLLLILPLTLFYEAALMKSFVAGKRVVKTSNFSKEMDANRVSSLLPLFVILFHQLISFLLISSLFFSMIVSLLVY